MRLIKMFLFSLLLCFLMSGCAVLTTSQIQEVQKFAFIVHESGEFPVAVMRAYTDLREKRKCMDASSALNGMNAFTLLQTNVAYHAQYESLINRTDTACQILIHYADLLLKLTDNAYQEKIHSSAEQIAQALDESIKNYNTKHSTSLGLAGEKISAMLNSAGMLFIKRRQSIILKRIVIEASPIIFEITNAMSDLLELYINSENRLMEKKMTVSQTAMNEYEKRRKFSDENTLIEKEKIYIEDWYLTIGYTQPLSTTIIVSQQLKAADDAILLAQESKNAIEKINEAHVVLVEKLKKKAELEEPLEIIQLLIEQVKKARQLMLMLETIY